MHNYLHPSTYSGNLYAGNILSHTARGHVPVCMHRACITCEVQVRQALLACKRLAAASDVLETYGVSSEADVHVVHESDLSALDITLKPLQRRTKDQISSQSFQCKMP